MLLVANVGNTHVRLGAFEEGDEPVLAQAVAVDGLDALDAPKAAIEALVIGSVNPEAAARLRAWAAQALRCPVLELRAELPVPLRFACDDPGHVGADRIASAIALHKRTGRGGIAVDFGTAISLAVVSPDGVFLGGAIAAGLAMSARALHADTALLPLVDAAGVPPELSCCTETAIATGLLWGLAGLADRLIERFAEEVFGGTGVGGTGVPPVAHRPEACATTVLATGGDAPAIVPFCRRVHALAPHLTLEGLRHAYLQRPR
ncbi:MAG: type III pantothenate kinase [Planctomycetes bacterium]|nr:type III pantothenate kinase [Planctomycetota bacterium]